MGNLISSVFFSQPHSSKDRLLNDFSNSVQRTMTMEEFMSEFCATRDYAQQIGLVKPFLNDGFELERIKQDDEEDCLNWDNFEKSDEMSSKYCDKMKELCSEKLFVQAEQECNLALCYAKTNEFLGAAFAARSILLSHLKEYETALSQIEKALKLIEEKVDPKNKNECLEGIRSVWKQLKISYKKEIDKEQELTMDEKQVKESWAEEIKNRKEFCSKSLFQIKSPSPIAPAMEDFVEIKFNSERGRHLVVTKNVDIGETLLVEKPFVSGLNGTLGLNHGHCHHCLKRKLGYIPCPNCVFALFCDEKCLNDAATYHKYECPCLPDLRSILLYREYREASIQNCFDGVNFHLAFKLICILGPRKLFRLFKSENRRNVRSSKQHEIGLDKTKKVCEILGVNPKTGIYESSSYTSVVHLATEFTPQKGHYQLALISLILVEILENRTNFFNQIDPNLCTKFQEFIAQRILQHYAGIRVNIFCIWELNFDQLKSPGVSQNKIRLEFDKVNLFARGLYPTASLLNHHCDPNVMLFPGPNNGEIAIVAVKPLKIGQELSIFYCPLFSEQTRLKRQQRLSMGYNFHCNCVACLDEWPTAEGLNKISKRFCCRNCSAQLFQDTKTQERMLNFELTQENGFKCPTCQFQFSESNILNEFSKHKRKLTMSLRQVQNNYPLEALKDMKLAMEFFDKNVIPPNALQMFIQKSYIEAIQCIVHFAK